MILDKQTLFSDQQAITADAASTNIYDTGADADAGPGRNLEIMAYVKVAFNTLTSLNIILETDADVAFGSAKTLWTVNRVLAALTLGANLQLPPVPHGAERYLRLRYDVVGTDPTLGKITAGIILDHQANVPTPGGTAY